METSSGATISSWTVDAKLPAAQKLTENASADVCIIGGGISGLTTAYLLAKARKSVIVLEQGEIAGNDTSRTSAHLASELDDTFVKIEKCLGKDRARLAAQSHADAINKIEQIASDEKIACDFERVYGYLFVPPGQSTHILDDELAASRSADLTVDRVIRAPIPSFDTGPALRFANQAQFQPLKYIAGLVQKIQAAGGKIYNHTHAKKITRGKQAQIITGDGKTVTSDFLVIATNSPLSDHYAMMTKLFPHRSYAIAAPITRGTIEHALFWDTAEPYHYVRLQNHQRDDLDLLIVGGEDHKVGQADDGAERFARLESWTRERFPMIRSIEYRWSGQILETLDGLGYIGLNPSDEQNVYIITGDSGHGLTNGTLGGMIVSDLIQGKHNPYSDLYNPKRKAIRAAQTYASENLNLAAQYTSWLTGGEVKSADQIPPGHGAVIRRGLSKVAAYKDDAGIVHECSAVCRHFDCIVAWNSEEKTWDCPCHGSRFDPSGKVITGPAISNLAPVEHLPEEIHQNWKEPQK